MLTKSQQVAFELEGANYKLLVEQLLIDVDGKSVEAPRGVLAETTAFIFTNDGGSPITIAGACCGPTLLRARARLLE